MSSIFDRNIIHPNATIGEGVTMGKGNIIEANCVIEGYVEIGDYNHFNHGVITHHNVRIGNLNKFYPYVTLGFPGEMGAKGDLLPESGFVWIGDHVTLREYVNIHAPFYWESTKVDDHAYIMNKAYVAHDVQIGENATINAGVSLGGRVIIEPFATVGMNATVHQRSVVGQSAMVGMGAVVKKHIPPFAVVAGVPAQILKFNKIGAVRRGFEEIDFYVHHFRDLYTGKHTGAHFIDTCVLSFYEKYPDSLKCRLME